MSEASQRNVSGEIDPTTLSEGMVRALKFTSPEEPLPDVGDNSDVPEMEDQTAMLLKKTLSTRSVLFTPLSYAQRMQKAALKSEGGKSTLRQIGLGSCGSVFEIPGTEIAYKKGTKELDIHRDYRLTRKVHEAVAHVVPMLQKAYPELQMPKTPQCHDFHAVDDDSFWTENLQRFPMEFRTRQPLFTVDHILPLPKATRKALIERYFDDDAEIQQEAMDDRDNKDCLVRIYFGEKESLKQQTESYDSLRNFPLRLNMMEDLDLDTSDLAKEMAFGLAIIHWQAQVDAMDVEFVLGSSATLGDGNIHAAAATEEPPNFLRRSTHLFMFDFDKAKEFELTERDVKEKLMPAFLGNDPYYPRPQVDEELWEDFCTAYLKASKLILKAKQVKKAALALPKLFIAEVVGKLKETEDWNEEENIVFAD